MRFESKTLSAKALDFNRKSETNTSSHDLKNNVIIFLASIFFFFFANGNRWGETSPCQRTSAGDKILFGAEWL